MTGLGITRRFDLVPANISGLYKDARLYIHNGIGAVWLGRNGKAVLERTVQVASVEQLPKRGQYEVHLSDGEVWQVQKAGHCACGSPLKKFNPATAHPKEVA